MKADMLVGWLGGNKFITKGFPASQKRYRFNVSEISKAHIGIWSDVDYLDIMAWKVCCNKEWIVLSGAYTGEEKASESDDTPGLFVYKVANAQLLPDYTALEYPWAKSVLWLRFVSFSEYEAESDVVEAIFTEQRSTDLFLCVVHIYLKELRLVGDRAPHTFFIGEVNLTKMGIKEDSIRKPLVLRSAGIYCFILDDGSGPIMALVLSPRTSNIITLVEDCNSIFSLDAVDDSHLCITNSESSVASVYSLSDLLSSPSSCPPSPLLPSSGSIFGQHIPCHNQLFREGSHVKAGGGLIIISSHLWKNPTRCSRPRFSKTEPTDQDNFAPPSLKVRHQFVDGTTEGFLFTIMMQNDCQCIPSTNDEEFLVLPRVTFNELNMSITCHVTASSQILQLLLPSSYVTNASAANTTENATPKNNNVSCLRRRCYLGILPRWVLVDCIGKMWVMRPERRLLVQGLAPHTREWNEGGAHLFFSVSPTLGLVQEPVWIKLMQAGMMVGWLGGNKFVTKGWGSGRKGYKHSLSEMSKVRLDSWNSSESLDPTAWKSCCNKKWIVLSGLTYSGEEASEPDEPALIAYKAIGAPLLPGYVMGYTWSNSVLWLRFVSSSEYDLESDFAEAIFTEHRGTDLFLCVVHIDLKELEIESVNAPEAKFVGAANLTKMGIKEDSIRKPLVVRSAGIYCFILVDGSGSIRALVLSPSTSNIITLVEDCNSIFTIGAVDESHLCITNSESSVASVYSVSDLLLSPSSPSSSCPPSSLLPSSGSIFVQHTPCHHHSFKEGSHVKAGGGLIIVSSHLWKNPTRCSIPRFSKTEPADDDNFPAPSLHLRHQFVDGTTGTLLFTILMHDDHQSLPSVMPVPFRVMLV
ncbi:hypothetical protein Pelo_6658 [Pelomyxa schiedti]|nr:hypothetical protein Pelo_6658 [Pelomyxa schiedti]